MFENWKMVIGVDQPVFSEMPRIQVVRSSLYNHLYHQMILTYMENEFKEG